MKGKILMVSSVVVLPQSKKEELCKCFLFLLTLNPFTFVRQETPPCVIRDTGVLSGISGKRG